MFPPAVRKHLIWTIPLVAAASYLVYRSRALRQYSGRLKGLLRMDGVQKVLDRKERQDIARLITNCGSGGGSKLLGLLPTTSFATKAKKLEARIVARITAVGKCRSTPGKGQGCAVLQKGLLEMKDNLNKLKTAMKGCQAKLGAHHADILKRVGDSTTISDTEKNAVLGTNSLLSQLKLVFPFVESLDWFTQ